MMVWCIKDVLYKKMNSYMIRHGILQTNNLGDTLRKHLLTLLFLFNARK